MWGTKYLYLVCAVPRGVDMNYFINASRLNRRYFGGNITVFKNPSCVHFCNQTPNIDPNCEFWSTCLAHHGQKHNEGSDIPRASQDRS